MTTTMPNGKRTVAVKAVSKKPPEQQPPEIKTETAHQPPRDDMTNVQWFVAAVIGIWLTAVGIAAIVAMFWAWNIAGRLTGSTTDVPVSWIGPDFTASATTAAFLLAAAAGVAGSVVHIGTLFSSRVGRRTFEASYTWWYLLRPLLAALLAVLVVAAVRAGTVSIGSNGSDNSAPVLAFLVGGIAGLFTDRVMQKMRGVLGSTSPEQKASEQQLPR